MVEEGAVVPGLWHLEALNGLQVAVRRGREHLLKPAYSPAEAPRFDWIASVLDARPTLSDKISPTLRQDAQTMLEKLHADARKRADAGLPQHGEPAAAAELPRTCPFSLDEILLEDWYPEKGAVEGGARR